MGEVKSNSLKYGKMNFEDFWKEHVKEVNEEQLLKYNKAGKFKRVFLSKSNSLLNGNGVIKMVAKGFFERGRLQMISEINMSRFVKDEHSLSREKKNV